MNPTNVSVPFVVERTADGERSYDLASRLMSDRIIMIDSGFDSNMAHVIKMQLAYLDSIGDDLITMYITSPGGSVHDGLGILDTARNCRSPIRTIVMGYAASMGHFTQSVLGTPGERLCGENAYIMMHSVSSGTEGTIHDQKRAFEHSEALNKVLMKHIAEACGESLDVVMRDAERDFWMDAHTALNYGTKGFVDGILLGKRNELGQHLVLRRNNVQEWI